ncbi:MAG: hypothetical protein ABEI96_05945 [Haloarculaceae archaeon]
MASDRPESDLDEESVDGAADGGSIAGHENGPPNANASGRRAGVSLDASTVGPLFGRGVVTAVASYLLLVVVVFVGPSTVGAITPELFVNLGEVFYSAHNVSLIAPRVVYNAIVAQARLGGTSLPVAVYFLLPLIPLVAAGVELGANDVDRTAPRQHLVSATFVFAVGYAATLLVGTLAFGPLSVHPDYVRTVVFGLAYPVVFVLAGAVVGRWLRERF